MPKLNPEEISKLLKNQNVPGSYREFVILSSWIEDIIKNKGEDYIKSNRKRILRDWIRILEFGLSRI
jgi:hypothetical protein